MSGIPDHPQGERQGSLSYAKERGGILKRHDAADLSSEADRPKLGQNADFLAGAAISRRRPCPGIRGVFHAPTRDSQIFRAPLRHSVKTRRPLAIQNPPNSASGEGAIGGDPLSISKSTTISGVMTIGKAMMGPSSMRAAITTPTGPIPNTGPARQNGNP